VNTGYAASLSGRTYKTTNTGGNWYPLQRYTTKVLRTIYFINNNTGFICGNNGCIMKTTDGGGQIFTGINHTSSIVPQTFLLYQNYPNPFNPATKIRFSLPKSSFATIVIYDVLGRELKTLVNEQLNAGTYEAEWSADKFSSGVYYYKLIAGDFSETRKAVLIK
jgi:hypothetical protein